jgi:hypothetical protein
VKHYKFKSTLSAQFCTQQDGFSNVPTPTATRYLSFKGQIRKTCPSHYLLLSVSRGINHYICKSLRYVAAKTRSGLELTTSGSITKQHSTTEFPWTVIIRCLELSLNKTPLLSSRLFTLTLICSECLFQLFWTYFIKYSKGLETSSYNLLAPLIRYFPIHNLHFYRMVGWEKVP